MLKILHAIRSVNPASGGPLEGVLQISKINLSFGHSAEILSLDAPDDPWVLRQPCTVHAMGPAISAYCYCPRLTEWLRANRKNYDVVVINGIWAYNAFGVWRALVGTDTPYFVYTHGMLDPWFKYRYPWKHAKKWLFWPWAVFPVLRDATGVMFTCEEERLLARKSFWLYDCNEIVVDYGTPGVPDSGKDYAGLFLEKYPEFKAYRRFVFLGRVHSKKAPDIILKTLAKLQAQGLWDPLTMRLIMAGPSDGDYADCLKILARKLRIEDSVIWTGMLLGDDKWGVLACSEAFLLPSHQENFGIAVAESLSVSVPVLISRCVNIWREIVADRAGLADEDTEDGCFRQWSEWLSYSPLQRAEMGDNARNCFLRRYTALNAARSLLSNIYLMDYNKKSRAAFRGQGA